MSTRSTIRRAFFAGLLVAAVAAAPAGAAISRFLDVPDTNTFVGDIEWLADAGVTKGCGTDLFCPDANVTREQMAAFLHRLAENEVVAAASAVTADSADSAASAAEADHAVAADTATTSDTAALADDSSLLDGRAPATYDTFVIGDARHAGDMGGYLTICTVTQLPYCATGSAEGALVAEATFTTVAADSTVAVTGMTALASLEDMAAINTWVWLQLDSSACTDSINAGATAAYTKQTLMANVEENIVVTIAFEIPDAGEHTVTLCAQPYGGNAGVLASTISGVVSASPNNVTSQHFAAP